MHCPVRWVCTIRWPSLQKASVSSGAPEDFGLAPLVEAGRLGEKSKPDAAGNPLHFLKAR